MSEVVARRLLGARASPTADGKRPVRSVTPSPRIRSVRSAVRLNCDSVFLVERVPVPRWTAGLEATEVENVFGEQAEWGFSIPWTCQVLASPRSHRPMLRAPEPGDDLLPGALAYWSSLLHLLVYGFGWSHPGRGLRWWYDAGKPIDDPKLALLSEVWGADGQLDWFAAWLWTTGACSYLCRSIGFTDDNRVKVDPGWLEGVEHQISESRTPSPYGGGSDPLHLTAHIGGPMQRRVRGRSHLTLHPSTRRTATLVTDSMTGWYGALADDAAALPDHETGRSWEVDVVVRPVGWLGTFRRSRTTGLWYSGRHRHHVVGN